MRINLQKSDPQSETVSQRRPNDWRIITKSMIDTIVLISLNLELSENLSNLSILQIPVLTLTIQKLLFQKL